MIIIIIIVNITPSVKAPFPFDLDKIVLDRDPVVAWSPSNLWSSQCDDDHDHDDDDHDDNDDENVEQSLLWPRRSLVPIQPGMMMLRRMMIMIMMTMIMSMMTMIMSMMTTMMIMKRMMMKLPWHRYQGHEGSQTWSLLSCHLLFTVYSANLRHIYHLPTISFSAASTSTSTWQKSF